MKEAVATIIYAAPRVEIKELSTVCIKAMLFWFHSSKSRTQKARLHLIAKFGKEFGVEASENTTNCVNPRVCITIAKLLLSNC